MATAMITIDGRMARAAGRSFGPRWRSSLVTGRPFRIERIRAGRAKPGLLRQHLTAVQAAAPSAARAVTGAEIGSRELAFEPGAVRGGEYPVRGRHRGQRDARAADGAAVPLALAPTPSQLVLEGGTHNPFAPPFDFLDRTFLPVLRRMGAGGRRRGSSATVSTRRAAGGSRSTIEPAGALAAARR